MTVQDGAACGEFRRWALNHKTRAAGVRRAADRLTTGGYDIADECAVAFAGTFFAMFLELWHNVPVPVPADEADRTRGCATSSAAIATRLGTSIHSAR